ncbi:hypothetical protein [Bacillus velezensis]|uniref:hypothetical protein n=2 Tax=Bacillaceae TaxID=186817 RepID=UPI0020A6ED82|nr:hypothetical protein [Bacillus velezensis]USY34556.1 hypothetical protein NIZ95_09180 [Bacillus velezensis]
MKKVLRLVTIKKIKLEGWGKHEIHYSNVVKLERGRMGWTFCSLATEGAGSNSNQQCSIHFDEFKDALENGKMVDTQNVKSSSEFRPILR